MSERDELIVQANELALEFPGNISTAKLKDKIDTALGNTQTEKPKDEGESKAKVDTAQLSKRQKIAERKKAAYKTRVVTLTNKDPRDSDSTNTAHLSFENSYFSLAKNVPLDIPVELEAALIKIAAGTMMPLHRREMVNGKPTGNSVTIKVPKYAISYGE